MSERKSETPVMGVSDYYETLKKEGIVHIPDPHGRGWYRVESRQGSVYFSAKLTWVPRDPHDPTGRKAGPAYLRSKYGREILWYPRGLGVMYSSDAIDKFGSYDAYYLYTAKMAIGFILAGRKLYNMTCGQNISSLNNDDDSLDYSWA